MTATNTPAPVDPATHEHYTKIRRGGKVVATRWSTRDECSVCGCGHPL